MALDLLSLVYQYRCLRDYSDVFYQPLEGERAEHLQSLEVLFTSAAGGDERRTRVRCSVEIPAMVDFRGRLRASSIVDIGGDGMGLDAALPVLPGEHVVVMVQDAKSAKEFRFPAEVMWCGEQRLGVRFDGLPIEIRRRRWVTEGDEAA